MKSNISHGVYLIGATSEMSWWNVAKFEVLYIENVVILMMIVYLDSQD